eukprot:4482264-Lingulodinium_polyedra.AAC.1
MATGPAQSGNSEWLRHRNDEQPAVPMLHAHPGALHEPKPPVHGHPLLLPPRGILLGPSAHLELVLCAP